MSVTRAGILKLKGDLMLMQEMSPGIKPNFSKLARETGISRQTIAKIWNDPAAPPKPRQKRKSKFDPYYDEIRDVKCKIKCAKCCYEKITSSCYGWVMRGALSMERAPLMITFLALSSPFFQF